MLHRLGWAVGVIIGDVVYLPAVDAAAIVNRLDVSENPRPTSPIDEAGPLNGKIPPIFISDGVTPGGSAANAVDPSANSISAKVGLKYLSTVSSPCLQRSARPRRGRDPANRDRCSAVFFPTYSSFLELVTLLREWFAAQPRSGFNPR